MTGRYTKFIMQPEDDSVNALLQSLPWNEEMSARVHEKSLEFVNEVRGKKRKAADLEAFFQNYGLDTAEGLALMCMAEALLRIPDTPTATALIRDKVAATNWLKAGAGNKDFLAKAAGLGLSLTSSTMNSLFSKLGEPVIRNAMMQAMRLLGKQFVVGQSIENALKNAKKKDNEPYRMSYDMLGEGARTAATAERYFQDYIHAIETIAAKSQDGIKRPGISVKLSALHPRYEFAQKEKCVSVLVKKLSHLCALSAQHNLTLTMDAEEADRLELSMMVFEKVLAGIEDRDWKGFGLAVQAYQKRSPHIIDHVVNLARNHKQKLQIRLVKGAYWDTEIKHAQVLGLDGYPVFTRKCNTDLSYLACAHKMLQHNEWIDCLFGTHNAHTIMAITDMAQHAFDTPRKLEFQKLFGMGNALHAHVLSEGLADVSVYAPVGVHEDLLPYLVRRLLENGANSSFVKMIYDENVSAAKLVADPVKAAASHGEKQHPQIPLPKNIYAGGRENSSGLDLSDRAQTGSMQFAMERGYRKNKKAYSLIAGKAYKGGQQNPIYNPADTNEEVGFVQFAAEDHIDAAFNVAQKGHQIWRKTPPQQRAAALLRFADLLESNKAELMMLCVKEAGKTLGDARDDVREAVDFARYYAQQGEALFDEDGVVLQGPTGEENIHSYESRGVFVCISPWNFPLAIFAGPITAALMAGNAVVAKPAEQTPLIATRCVELMIKAGIVREAITLIPGDGRIGAALVAHKNVGGVAFTGSTQAAQQINQSLAAKKDAAIVPFIAETGGQNAFIADSSALPEQVVDDVIHSAFGSAGQRCSAARVLFVQEDCADTILDMLAGAMDELVVGDPYLLSTDIGPVIDEEALSLLKQHKRRLDGFANKIAQTPMDEGLKQKGHFFAPCAYEIDEIAQLKREVFGPILHVIRYKRDALDDVIEQINESGYGLTLGLHSRIEAVIDKVSRLAKVGNVYINRGTTGAVVGVQPFGGRGLSGTGPKAGGADYLKAFSTQKHVSRDITASGGNTSLVMIS